MGHPLPVSWFFLLFSNNISQKKLYLGFSGIQFRVITLEDEHADHPHHGPYDIKCLFVVAPGWG